MGMSAECRVYSRFSAKRADGSVIKLRVQEVPPGRLDDVLSLYLDHFIREEPVHRSTGIYLNEAAKEELGVIFKGMVEENNLHVAICCEDKDPKEVGDVAGASVMYEATVNDNRLNGEAQTQEVRLLFSIGEGASGHILDECTKQNVQKYLEDFFVVVHPNYRKLGIASELIKSRRIVCKDSNIPFTIAWMSALGTQKAAEADEWATAREFSFDELAKLHGVTFDSTAPSTKLMMTWANK